VYVFDPQVVRPIIIDQAAAAPAEELSIGGVILQALGLSGLLLLGSLVLGLALGAAIIYVRHARRVADDDPGAQIQLHLEPPPRRT